MSTRTCRARCPAPPSLRARLPRFVGGRADAAAALRRLKVALVGAGSVGRNIALHLARFGGTLWLADRGRLKPESLLTHPLTGPADIGEPKASNLARALRACGFRGQLFVHDGPVEDLSLAAFADADLVVLATDNLRTELWVGGVCLRLGKGLVHASVHGETLVSQVRFFSGRVDAGCPACGYTKAEWQALADQTTFSCSGFAAGARRAADAPPPTMSTSFLCSLAADLAMTQILRFALGLGAPVADTFLEHCGYTHRTVVAPLARNPACPCDHTAYRQVRLGGQLGALTLRELTAAAGLGPASGRAPLSFTVDRFAFAEMAGCACSGQVPLGKFVLAGQAVGECPKCQHPIVAHPFYLHRPVPASVVEAVLDRPLHALGAGAARSVAVRGDDRAVLLLERRSRPEGVTPSFRTWPLGAK
ncbi:MAG TPA: ThiF family adenylyltransferase [Planctomycetota bacterium]|nr:ThiF family adenylyltransferase [Planctomycetota bacterium]